MQKESQAEVKLFKVGETVASKVAGNPEPSISEKSERACVETGRRVCIKCGGDIPSNKYSNAKYCSDRCRSAYISLQHAYKTGRIKKPGVGSGGNQVGENNHQYKTGVGTYSKKGFKVHGNTCNRCSEPAVLIHHMDHDRTNNLAENLEPLCKSCHQRHHEQRDEKGRYTKGQSTLLETTD